MKIHTKALISLSVMVFACSLGWGCDEVLAYDISLNTSGPININVRGDNGNAVVSSDNITVNTSCRSGYNFVISSSVNDNNLYLDGDETNNATGTYFAPVDGTSTLANTVNSWGYYYDATNTPTTASVFSAVPTLGNSAVIRAPLETPSETDISDSFNIYYGVSVSDTMKSGVYTMLPDANASGNAGAIVYQATVADACMRYTVNFNPTDTYTGSAVTGTGTMASQSIYEGVATTLNSNTFTAPTGYEFVGWNTAQDGSGTTYANGASVTDLALAGESITLYAMWSDCANGICYQQNGEDVVGTMGKQTVTADTAAPLFASNFSRTGYWFAGWSNVPDYETNQDAHFYGPMEDYTASASALARGVKLYAVWVASAGSLQDTNKVAELCGTGANALQTAPTDGTANLSSVSALTDQRDNQTYAIAKLADGKCWMIENLRLADTHQEGANTVPTTLTTTNTNNPLNNNDPTNPTVTLKHNYSDTNTSPTLSSTSSDATSWCQTNSAACDDQSRLRTDNTASRVSYRATDIMSNSANLYSYGNYYNWYSATAGNGTYSFSTNNNSVGGDLCPAGWRLPKGGNKTRIENNGDNEFWNLAVVALNNNTLPANYSSSNYPYYTGDPEGKDASKLLRTYPNNLLYSGYVNGASINYRGNAGSYWSSTAYSSDYAYLLSLGSSGVSPGTVYSYKYYGRAVRCLAAQ